MRRLQIMAVAAVALGLATGCTEDRQDLERWVVEVLARPAGEVDPIPRVETPEPVIYDAYDLRDPFMREPTQAEQTDSTGTGPRPDPDRRQEYLEQFPLDALEMVGTIEIGDAAYGLIQDPEDTVHRVREGNYLGQNHGRIVAITPVAIELVELVPDGTDGWMEREARIALPEDDQGSR